LACPAVRWITSIWPKKLKAAQVFNSARNKMTKYPYNSLDDFLKSHRLDVDGLLDDGWGAPFPVKG
jgi:hypothetical protein